jgi:hypothetical protein
MSDREALIAGFLARAGWRDAARGVLADDASFRRYDRLARGDGRAVLMDAPPPMEDVRPFIHIDRILRRMGLSAPEILAEDVTAGLLLLEDLGDNTYARVLAEGGDEAALYELAVDLLVELHRQFAAGDDDPLPPYDDEAFLTEATLLTDWYMPALSGRETPAAQRAEYCELWLTALPRCAAGPRQLRPGFPVRGCPARRAAGADREIVEALSGRLPRTRPRGLRRVVRNHGRAARRQDPGHFHPAGPARRQARLPDPHSTGLALAGRRPGAPRVGRFARLVRA